MPLEINQYANIQKSAIKIKGSDVPGITPEIPNYSGTTYSGLTENDYFAIGGFAGNENWILDRQFFVNTADKRLFLRTNDTITEFQFAATDIYTTGATLSANTIVYDRNDGNYYSIDLTPVLSAGTLNYFTTGATLTGNVLSFDRNDLVDAYQVDLSSLSPTGTTNYLAKFNSTGTNIEDSNVRTLDNKYVAINTTPLSGTGLFINVVESGIPVNGQIVYVTTDTDITYNFAQQLTVENLVEGQSQTLFGQAVTVNGNVDILNRGLDRGYGQTISVNNLAEGTGSNISIGSYIDSAQLGGFGVSVSNYADSQVLFGGQIHVAADYPNSQVVGLTIDVNGAYASGATALVIVDGTQDTGKVWTAKDISGAGYWSTPIVTTSLDFSAITNTPTTLSGYGITDAIIISGTSSFIPKFNNDGTNIEDSNIQTLDNKCVAINSTPISGTGLNLEYSEIDIDAIGQRIYLKNSTDGTFNFGQKIIVENLETGQTQSMFAQQLEVNGNYDGFDRGYGQDIVVTNVIEGQCLGLGIASAIVGAQLGGFSVGVSNYVAGQVLTGGQINIQSDFDDTQAVGLSINVSGAYASGATALVINDGTQSAGKVWTAKDISGAGYWETPSVFQLSGTTDYIPKFNLAGTNVENSVIRNIGNDIAINGTPVSGTTLLIENVNQGNPENYGQYINLKSDEDATVNIGQKIDVKNETPALSQYMLASYIDMVGTGNEAMQGQYTTINGGAAITADYIAATTNRNGANVIGGSINLDSGADNQVLEGLKIRMNDNHVGTQVVALDINTTVGSQSGGTALKITDGTQGLGKVWTSDSQGYGSWQATSTPEVKTTTTGVTTGDTVVCQEIFGSDTGMDEYYYVAVNQSNTAKTVGKMMSNRLTTTIAYNDYGTSNIGDCSGISFRVEVEDVVRNNVVAIVTNDVWTVNVWHKRIS
jgi:hypothetical protein